MTDKPVKIQTEMKPDPKEIAREFSPLPGLIFRRVRLSFVEKGEITHPQMAILQLLHDYPGEMRMTDLAKRMSASMPTTTGIISRLVEKGLIERGGFPNDRRVVTVSLTKEGRKMSGKIINAIVEMWSALISELSEDEQVEFLHLIRKIKNVISMEESK